jgi:hypothetical protein
MAAGIWSPSSGIGDANIALSAAALKAAITKKTANRSLIMHPVHQRMLARDAGFGQLVGALGVQWGKIAIGQGAGTAVAEGSAASPANFSASTVSLTPGRKAYARSITDMGPHFQEALLEGNIAGMIAMLGYDAFGVWANTYVAQLTALYPSFSTALDLSSSALLTLPFLEICNTVRVESQAESGDLVAVLSAQQIKDLRADLLTLGGAVQFTPAAANAMQLQPDPNYFGRLFGFVDVYQGQEVTTDTGNSIGGVYGDLALASIHQRVAMQPGADVIADLGLLKIEARARSGTSTSIYDYIWHNAAGIDEQACGAKVVSRATV